MHNMQRTLIEMKQRILPINLIVFKTVTFLHTKDKNTPANVVLLSSLNIRPLKNMPHKARRGVNSSIPTFGDLKNIPQDYLSNN